MGGLGAVHLERRSAAEVLGPKGNFLLRSAEQLLSPDLAVAIVDAPSDQASGMEDSFRLGNEHATDQGMLVAALRRRLPGAKMFLVGTSRGTISAAYLAQALGPTIDGVALTSTVFRASKRGLGLSLFRFESIKTPLLLVHHAEDGCPVCPYKEAQALAVRSPLITVRGGIEPESGPCDPLSNHGYFGREAAVIQALRHWILGEPFPREIP
jgi:pimeloyl-ACP methyl ester carboxylesterase